MLRRRALLCALALLAACSPPVVGSTRSERIEEQWRAIAVQSIPVALGAETVGRLRFRGGIELRSTDIVFGGLSDLEVLDNNRVLILNDDAEWFDGRLVLDESGTLVGFADVRYALMLNERGRPYSPRAGDTEDLAQLLDGRFAVSFEQSQTISIFDMNRDGPFGVPTRGPRLAGVRRLPSNAGLEALTIAANGDLVVGAEGGERPTTPIWRAPLDSTTPAAPISAYPLAEGYSLTSLDRLPGSGFVALERFYAPVIGARTRITTFPDASLNAPSAVLPSVEELGRFAPPLLLDNFEGISATRSPDGGTRIYIVSDDNYSPRQRTLLYAFDVVSDAPSR